MSQYLVLSHIEVQNANSIAGFTWGFPAITSFLGFTHALNRKLSNQFGGEYDTEFTGCAVISHSYQNKVYQAKKDEYDKELTDCAAISHSNQNKVYQANKFADFEFIQSRNPPVLEKNKNGKKVPVIEEGKINLTVSLVIELNKALLLSNEQINQFEHTVLTHCFQMRLAGGSILTIKKAKLLSASTDKQHLAMLKKIKRLTLPGFVLLERSAYLQQHYQELLENPPQELQDKPTLFDAWLDFCALKSKAVPKFTEGQSTADLTTEADWLYQAKPKSGYLVPLMTGYKAISPVYAAGEIANTRDNNTPACFVEAIHSIGEWKGVHSLESIEAVIWRYHHDGHWYLCQQGLLAEHTSDKQSQLCTVNQQLLQTLNFNDALNNW